MADQNDDLAATKTEGFKVGEKKTLQEYQELGMFLFIYFLVSMLAQSPSLLVSSLHNPAADTAPPRRQGGRVHEPLEGFIGAELRHGYRSAW